MKPGRVSTTTTRGGGGSSSTSTSTGGGGATTPARARTTHPAAPPSNVAVSNKLASVFFIAILLAPDVRSKRETRQITNHSGGSIQRGEARPLCSSHHRGQSAS